ncbi:DUF2542 family protein [Pantoea dispersa]|uniref:DUF2542 family protein n=1 Tax=Pantoea dispersa TaxID=59814 RepID=UPI0021AF7077|nr:DUF2542 family protein [Pantoea dispersa]MCT6590663.1 DUF2542 family protein [Pantoea dispersa]
MDVKDWILVIIIFACGIITLIEAAFFLHRGVYTLRFKGTSRREYVHRSDRYEVYWLYMLLHTCAGLAMIALGFWIMQLEPTVNGWYQAICGYFTF